MICQKVYWRVTRVRSERKVIVRLVENGEVHNGRLLAEYFAQKIKERGVTSDGI